MGASSNLLTGQTTVSSTTAVQLYTTAGDLRVNGILVSNLSTDSVSIFVGTTGVTATTGLEIVKGNAPVLIPVEWASEIWAITPSSTATLTWMFL